MTSEAGGHWNSNLPARGGRRLKGGVVYADARVHVLQAKKVLFPQQSNRLSHHLPVSNYRSSKFFFYSKADIKLENTYI